MRKGAVDNGRKTINSGKTVAAFCMGAKKTYEYISDNMSVEFRTIDYTDNPMVIAQHDNMTAINSALGIDLTGQATEESVGRTFYGGIGGQAGFMRGAVLSKNGKSILVLESTAENGKASRIMPFLKEGAGVTLNRGDVHYVVTEYGIAHLHGKNVRERAIELISIAHPKFRYRLIEEAKKLNLIYGDQAYVAGKKGMYPEELEAYRTTEKGMSLMLRPVKMSDEPPLKEFFYSLSEDSLYHRFVSARKDMLHARLQDFTAIDYTRRMIILASIPGDGKEEVVGIGQYDIDEKTHTGELAFVVRDVFHNRGVGKELLKYLTYIAKKKGLLGFTAEVLTDNEPMIHLFKEAGYDMEKKTGEDAYHFRTMFRRRQ
jgi:RimJ/RimL family protein N-acetyltransferase